MEKYIVPQSIFDTQQRACYKVKCSIKKNYFPRCYTHIECFRSINRTSIYIEVKADVDIGFVGEIRFLSEKISG